MSNQGNYKRTVAGSVGAGMGAIFNGSGRTYYILEHKTQSKYHNVGESQKIIIDQVEIGRDSSCQVRYDESFDTVSRKHAAIVRDGNNWELIHLSTSNPTLVNGRPIQGHYYLQSGDEIQLSAGGPRLGFIQPQGKQALTSSIRLTERMNLFRQQALRPYRRAIWALSSLLLLTILGFGIWNYKLHGDLNEAKQEVQTLVSEAGMLDAQIDSLNRVIATGAGNTEELQRQVQQLGNRRAQVVTQYRTIVQRVPEVREALREENIPDLTENKPIQDNPVYPSSDKSHDSSNIGGGDDAKGDARAYYPCIYRIIVESITLEDRQGNSRPANIATSKINGGMGFVLPNGDFVTARQNIQPWIYVDGNAPSGDWRKRLAVLYSLGYDINIAYSAYSTDGPAARLQISSRDFSMPVGGDIITAHVSVSEAELKYFEELGVLFDKTKLLREGIDIKRVSSSARSFALLSGTGRPGIPTDNGAANSMAGGTSLGIVYYSGGSVQNLGGSAQYYTATTTNTDSNGGTIHLQGGPGASAFGAPVFMKESDGSLMVVGVYVGGNRVIPISRCR